MDYGHGHICAALHVLSVCRKEGCSVWRKIPRCKNELLSGLLACDLWPNLIGPHSFCVSTANFLCNTRGHQQFPLKGFPFCIEMQVSK